MASIQVRARLEKNVGQLPILPQVVVQLMSLDQQSDQYFEDLLQVIERDPSFSVRLIKSANSALSGAQEPVASLRGALSRVGARNAAGLVTALSVTRVFVPRDAWERGLWRHSLQVAHAAKAIAGAFEDASLDPSTAYTSGLLHDVGRFVILLELPGILRRIDAGDWAEPSGLLLMENDVCGITHPELGALACERWRLPALLTEIVRQHHSPPATCPLDAQAKTLLAVQAADLAMFSSTLPGSPASPPLIDIQRLDEVSKVLRPLFSATPQELQLLLTEAAIEADASLTALCLA